jgi:hypothetical protein
MKIGDSEHSRTPAQILVTFVNELLLLVINLGISASSFIIIHLSRRQYVAWIAIYLLSPLLFQIIHPNNKRISRSLMIPPHSLSLVSADALFSSPIFCSSRKK